jgi:hypothetical protein
MTTPDVRLQWGQAKSGSRLRLDRAGGKQQQQQQQQQNLTQQVQSRVRSSGSFAVYEVLALT